MTDKTPQIRFKGFDAAWEEKKLGESVVFFNGQRVPIESTQREPGIYPYYGATGIIDFISEYIFDGEYVLLAEDGANILARNSPIAYLTKGKFWLNNHAHIMRMRNGANNFLVHYLEIISYSKFNSGTAQPKLNLKSVKKILMQIPKQEEQSKIGNLFSKLDSQITLQQEQLDQQREFKKAMLQKMFPRKGAKEPEIRFNGFSGAWEEKKLKDIFQKGGSGGTPKSTNSKYYGGDIPFLAVSDISKSNGSIYETEKKITKLGLESSSAWIVPAESISLAMYASVGKVAILKVDTATSQAFYNMIFENLGTRDFIYQYLLKMNLFDSWTKFISTGTQDNLNADKVKNLKVKLPSLEEQTKIGNFFKSLDEKIETLEQQLEQTKTMKQALLQKMFV